jgi:3-oxoacyl-[acyl-carrier protein] reductase
MKLSGRVALVTGGGSGIGRGAAISLAAEGAAVIVMGRRIEPLEETVKLIASNGGEALALAGDVTRTEEIVKVYNTIKERWGHLDILVNNAGSGMRKPFLEVSMEEFDQIYRIDLRSVFEVTKVMVPLMQSGSGSIINIASILGVLGSPNSSVYCAMKGGVVQLTRALAAELGPAIRVNCLCPSHIVTPMMEPALKQAEAKGKMDKLNSLFPMKRVGYPEDMNGSIVFFASDDSGWLTGNIFMVDGGLSCYV